MIFHQPAVSRTIFQVAVLFSPELDHVRELHCPLTLVQPEAGVNLPHLCSTAHIRTLRTFHDPPTTKQYFCRTMILPRVKTSFPSMAMI